MTWLWRTGQVMAAVQGVLLVVALASTLLVVVVCRLVQAVTPFTPWTRWRQARARARFSREALQLAQARVAARPPSRCGVWWQVSARTGLHCELPPGHPGPHVAAGGLTAPVRWVAAPADWRGRVGGRP